MKRSSEADRLPRLLVHPGGQLIELLRDELRRAHPGLQEVVKWGSPAYFYKGTFALISLRSGLSLKVEFPRGACLETGKEELIGTGKLLRTLEFYTRNDINKYHRLIVSLANEWVSLKDMGEISF